MYSKMTSHINKATANAKNLNDAVGPFVSALNPLRFPRAVFFVVAFVVVYPLQCHFCSGFSHVGVKITELQPSVAHRYPASSVGTPPRVIGVCASGNHVFPDAIDLGISHAVLEFPTFMFTSDERYCVRHCIGFLFALFSSGCPATTGTRCDYALTLNRVNSYGNSI